MGTSPGHISVHITQDMVILLLEAVLIEAMEPRQNRQRGYDLQDHEYIQVEDPDISEIREQALLKKMTQLLHSNKV
jgi:non-homologous end joining protein Ku